MEAIEDRLSLEGAVRRLGVTRGTFSRWLSQGKVRAETVPAGTSKRYVVDESEVNRIKRLRRAGLPLPVVVLADTGKQQLMQVG